jgi:multidrug efflux pump subunit AcrA (membrane-fusion protein)
VGFVKLDPRILPEMSVKVAFREAGSPATANTHMVTIPKGAVQQQDGKDVVYVVQNQRAERRVVSVSSTGPDEVLIAGGLHAGEQVVLDWPVGLADGMAVTTEK